MKIALSAQNGAEWLALQTGLIPQPVLLAHFGFLLSKVVWEAVECGVLDAVAEKKNTTEEIATHCQLHPVAVQALLSTLAAMQLLRFNANKYTLTAASRKWLLKSSPQSYRAQLQFDNQVCYRWMEHTGHYLKTGEALQYHNTLQPQEWQLYQDGMQATSGIISQIATRYIRVRQGATRLLDIGGAHGLYSAALLKKHSELHASVLDLPEAIAVQQKRGNPYEGRLVFAAGDIITDVLPKNQYDIVLMANVAHHFTVAQNEMVAQKVWRSLRRGGSFYILEFFKKEPGPATTDLIGALQSFFFSLSSTSGLWAAAEMQHWLYDAGFSKVKIRHFLQLPGFGMVQGTKLDD